MNRLLLIVVAAAVIALTGFAVFVIASGGPRKSPAVATAPGTPAAGPATVTAPPATESAAPPTAAADQDEANKRFDAWRGSMSAAGFTVKFRSVAMANNAVAAKDLNVTGLGWRWTASSARIDIAGKDNFEITATGDQTLSFKFNGEAVEYGASADEIRIGVHKGNDGRRVLSFEFANLTIAGQDDPSPITLASGGFRLVAEEDNDLAPVASDAELRLNKLVLPTEAGRPLGAKIDKLSATLSFQKPLANADPTKALQPWVGQTEALVVRALSFDWGSLRLNGVGVVGLDDTGRPTGRFEVRLPDVFALLDSINILHRFDRGVLANTYAKLLLDEGSQGNNAGLPFTITIANGAVTLSGRSLGIDDIALGAVGQFYAPTAAPAQ